MPGRKKFTKHQISKILAKASEFEVDQNYHSGDHDENDGISKQELLEIGREVGISQKALEHAIHQVKNQTSETFNWFIGSSELKASTQLEGEASELQINQFFPELNTFTGQKGHLEQVGNSYDWEQTGNGPESIRRITIIPKDGKTKVIQYVNWNELRFFSLGLAALLGSIALMILLKSIGLPKSTFIPLSPLGGLAGYIGTMGGLFYYFNKQKKKFASIMQLVTDTLERPAQHRLSQDELPDQNNEQIRQKRKTSS